MTWSVALGRLVEFVSGQSPSSEDVTDFDDSGGLPFLQGNAEFGPEHPQPIKKCAVAPRRAEPGDVLISVRAPVGALNVADRRYGIGRGLCAVRARKVAPRFLWWLLHAEMPQIQSRAVGSTYDAVTADDLGAIRVNPLPSAAAQRAIADYLDTETARLDTLIAKRRALTERLGERRQGVVDRVLPEPWTQTRRILRRITSGPRGWASYTADDGDLFLRITNVSAGGIDLHLDDVIRVRPPADAAAEAKRTRATPGSVLLSITANVGSVAVVPAGVHGYVSQHLALLDPVAAVRPRFLGYSLWASASQRQLDSLRYGGTKTQLSLEDVASVKIPLTGLAEQDRAIEQIDSELSQITNTLGAIEREVAKLIERRQALITAAVTGQIEVPGAPAA